MLYKKYIQPMFKYGVKTTILIFLSAVLLTACGREKYAGQAISDIDGPTSRITREVTDKEESFTNSGVDIGEDLTDVTPGNDEIASEIGETAQTDIMKQRFGATCISEQTFEVELSEYDGKVWFVPFAPSEEEDFHIWIMQDGEEPYELNTYVPGKLRGEEFVKLDAVAFFDVNYDNNTDIVLIETYGDTNFAAVYYGDVHTYGDDYRWVYFDIEKQLSANLTNSVEQLTIPVIRDFLGNGKKNGEFDDYREAYLAVAKLREMEGNEEIEYKYNLIYFDDDDIPELVEDDPGYYVSLYTYHDGRIYTLMDRWVYGAGGNHGYEYCPGKGSVRNYDTDYAGLILYTTYWTLGDEYELDRVVSIKFLNFIDANGNGWPDGDEDETAGYGEKAYIDDVEITIEEEMSYSMGEYAWLGAGANGMSLKELAEALK